MNIKKKYRELVKKLPYVRELVEEIEFYRSSTGFTPGEYYSPIVNTKELELTNLYDEKLFGIELNIDEQLSWLEQFKSFFREFPFERKRNSKFRYYSENEFYPFGDAVFLYSIIRHCKPKNIIEVGSGFSSALILDINELYFDNTVNLTCIEPNSERLKGLLKPNDNLEIIEKKVQEIDLELFRRLGDSDILFIDSSHVAKSGSDLNHILFNIFPALNKNVLIHFHDVFYPFEYPKKWIFDEKRNWNENYFLRSFLMYNNSFEIKFFNTYLLAHNQEWFKKNCPQCIENENIFGSLWLKKV